MAQQPIQRFVKEQKFKSYLYGSLWFCSLFDFAPQILNNSQAVDTSLKTLSPTRVTCASLKLIHTVACMESEF